MQMKANKNAPFFTLFFLEIKKKEFFYLETFGLLNFLLPLLDFTKKTTQNALEQTSDFSLDFPVQNAKISTDFSLEKQENSPILEQEKSEEISSQNAILAFYQAHEKRAKRTRK
jgi:hypothetical protein